MFSSLNDTLLRNFVSQLFTKSILAHVLARVRVTCHQGVYYRGLRWPCRCRETAQAAEGKIQERS